MTISSAKSNHLINSKVASQLISMDAPNIRNKAIYFAQSEGASIKFKSYEKLDLSESFIRPIEQKLNFGLDLQVMEVNSNTTDDKLDLGELGSMSLDDFSHLLK